MSIGIPIKLLHEAEGHTVTVELKNGEVYRGLLLEAEDNMNCQLSNISMTARDGRVSNLEQVFLRGSHIRFLILPDMLANAPMFKRIDPKVGVIRGRGIGTERARRAGGSGLRNPWLICCCRSWAFWRPWTTSVRS
mmetsp:Transcript_1881/g.5229  ORF Transcript_1881/g.5229 Transcript_1881/m.5229 type:complete len:136 (-) Transcript_1881:43-450(-)